MQIIINNVNITTLVIMTAMIALLIGAGITIIVLIIAKKIALTEHEIDEKEIRKIIEKI